MGGLIIGLLIIYVGLYTWAKGASGTTGNGFRIGLAENLESFLKFFTYFVAAIIFFIMVTWMSGSTIATLQEVGLTISKKSS
jgi:hypothetical protein